VSPPRAIRSSSLSESHSCACVGARARSHSSEQYRTCGRPAETALGGAVGHLRAGTGPLRGMALGRCDASFDSGCVAHGLRRPRTASQRAHCRLSSAGAVGESDGPTPKQAAHTVRTNGSETTAAHARHVKATSPGASRRAARTQRPFTPSVAAAAAVP
jgi:hypothetical protein